MAMARELIRSSRALVRVTPRRRGVFEHPSQPEPEGHEASRGPGEAGRAGPPRGGTGIGYGSQSVLSGGPSNVMSYFSKIAAIAGRSGVPLLVAGPSSS